MKTWKAAICDDESSQVKLLTQYLKEWGERENVFVQVQTYQSSESFRFDYEDQKDFDVLLLDIEMPGLDGMSLAKQLREQKEELAIIFISGKAEYVYEGYYVNAVSYLLKTVKREQLFLYLNRVHKESMQKKEYIIVQSGGMIQKIGLKEVVMEDGTHLPIARGKWEEVNRAYLSFYRNQLSGKEAL